MSFKQAYERLEAAFAQRVEQDNSCFGFESIFLPNIEPTGPVDYVLVGMEPSLGRWSTNLKEAKKKIADGFRNFCGVWMLHSPVKEYLCREGETYYLTDIAQGAMSTASSGAGNKEKYENWYPLLEKELGLVAKPEAKIISIGFTVGRFLAEKGLYGHAGTIPHYSAAATRYWGKEIPGREAEYENFAAGVHERPDGTCMSESQIKLMFDYKTRFERIRDQDRSGWLRWRQYWITASDRCGRH